MLERKQVGLAAEFLSPYTTKIRPMLDMTTIPPPAATEPSDADLVARSLAGNREAFGQIVARYQSLVCSLAYSATGSVSVSEDVAQETFVAAWKKLGDLRELERLRPWLCGIARNLSINRHRDGKREPTHGAESLDNLGHLTTDEASPALQAIQRDEEAILWRALEAIPETYREPLVLFYREHQSVASVAVALDLSEDNVRMRLSRGRKLLSEQVEVLVEGTLERTKPGAEFTSSVLAALPMAAATSGKTAAVGATMAKAAMAAKGAAATKATGLAGILGVIFLPVTAIFAALRLAVYSGGPDLTEEQIKARKKPSMARALVEMVLLGVILYSALHYYPTHPNWVYAGLGGFFIVHHLTAAWHDPQKAKAWLTNWRWDWKNVLKGIAGTLLNLGEATLLYFTTIHYEHATLAALRYICFALFLTLILLGMKKLTRWDWWRFALHRTGNATAWVMLFMVNDYWAAHPVDFFGMAMWLFCVFYAAKVCAEKWEAQTSPDPQKLQQWQQKELQMYADLDKAQKARDAVNPAYTELRKSQWAMTKSSRLAMMALFAVFVLALPKTHETFFSASPTFYLLLGLMSLSCTWTYFSWQAWRQRHREKIQAVRAVNDWMKVTEHLPWLTNVLMLGIVLRIFFNLVAPSISLTVAGLALGAGCGILARGFGRFGK